MNSPGKTFHFNKEITAEQLDFFDTYGYIHFRNFIDRDSLSNLVEEVGKVQQFLISNKIKKINGIPLKFGKDVDNAPLIQRIAFASKFSKPLHNFLHDQRLSRLTDLLGAYE